MKIAILLFLTFVGQWTLGLPGAPGWLQGVLLPVVWIVAPPMRHRFDHIFLTGLGLGLVWDLLFEPVVGPGLIAWSAAALAVAWIVRKVGDHSARSWGILGVAGALLISGIRFVAMLPLGQAARPPLENLLLGAVLTGVWCASVALVLAMDLPGRVRRYRRSRLR